MATDEITRCSVHPNEEASLTCGGCGKQICTICMTLTGEGPRCTDCMEQLNARYYGQASQAQSKREPNWTRPVEQVVIPVEAAKAESSSGTSPASSSEPQLIEINPVTGEASTDIVYCQRHPKIETGLRCARCNTPICPRCMVYTSVGLRCPNCAAHPQPSVKINPGAYAQNSSARRDTGFRTYWRRTNATYLIQPQHYMLAVLAAIGAALGGGLIWGFLLDAQRAALRGTTSGFVSSIHLVPEILLGVLIGEAVARATQQRRGGGLQLIAIAGVFLSYLVAIATMIVRAVSLRGGEFPPLNDLASLTWRTFTSLFSGGGASSGLSIILFFLLGAVFAWMRLKR